MTSRRSFFALLGSLVAVPLVAMGFKKREHVLTMVPSPDTWHRWKEKPLYFAHYEGSRFVGYSLDGKRPYTWERPNGYSGPDDGLRNSVIWEWSS